MSAHRPYIAISPNYDNNDSPAGFSLSIPGTYTRSIALAGGVPVMLCMESAQEAADRFDGLLLSGGPDIDPKYFGEEILNETVRINPARDEYELALIRAFLDAGKPILGICRGAQMLGVALGGTLYQDIPAQLGFLHYDKQVRHFVCAQPGTTLYRLFGERFRVNSLHHQAMRDLPEGCVVSARSQEGIIEAFEHESLPLLAVQFHPERLTGGMGDARTPDFLPLFEHFVARCASI